MRTIEVHPSKKFKGAWVAFEAPGVEPTFPGTNGKRDAISYAHTRFGGSRGEIHVYDDAGEKVAEKITIDGGASTRASTYTFTLPEVVATPLSRSQRRAPSAERLRPNDNKMGCHERARLPS